jgi:hypothetical protein
VLPLLDQLKVERVAIPYNQLESNGNSATPVDFGRHKNNDDVPTALGFKNSTRECS